MKSYEKIINHTHYQSKKRPHMSMLSRAAHFTPFAALSGFDEAVRETEQLTFEKPTLDEDKYAEIDRSLHIAVEKRKMVTIMFFLPNLMKSGGDCIPVTGFIRKILPESGRILMDTGYEISIDDICDLSILD